MIVRLLATQVVCNSEQTLAWIRGTSGPSDKRYLAIWNGYSKSGPAADRGSVRRELGVSGDEVLFVLVGRINAWKGQRLLVLAFAELVRETSVPVRLALVGSAFQGQSSFEDELREAIVASGCAERIGLYPFRADIEAVWEAADVAVVPSTQPEPFGRVAVEAMAFAKPVVAADHGGLSEIVKDGQTGLLVPPGDVHALSAALKRLAVGPEERVRLGEAGRQRQMAYFSVASYARGLCEVLTQAAAARRGTR
jgi:glycosyltransferase involved in cell wall biosynthesis